jgi:hypothetical protein
MSRAWTILVTAFLATGCAKPFVLDDINAVANIPYHSSAYGDLVIEVFINDQGPFDFVLDTGASMSVIFEDARQKAGLKLEEGNFVLMHGMVGSGDFPVSSIDRLQVGEISWTSARVVSMPSMTAASFGLDGVLGVDFLGQYAVAFSSEEDVVRFYEHDKLAVKSYRGWSSVPLRSLQIGDGDTVAYAFDLSIAGETVPALFDLGAGFNLMNWRAAQLLDARTKRSGGQKVHGAIQETLVSAQLEVAVLKIGKLYWRNTEFMVSDFPIFEVLELDDRAIAIVGAHLFNNRDFVIDFARDQLLVKAPD